MKKFFTLISGVALMACTYAQSNQCTVAGFDICSGASPVTSFTNAQRIGTNHLVAGAKYKFDNVTPGIDAIVTIDKMVNAKMKGTGVNTPAIDDDAAANETGVAGTQAALFSPRIAPDVELTCSPRTGYVQFTMKFYTHTQGANMPPASLAVPLINPNFLHFDMDGYVINPGGYFREIGYVKRLTAEPINPINMAAASTLLTGGHIVVNDSEGTWLRTNGATQERDGISRCTQVIEKTTYLGPQFEISFRFGYDYKPRNNCNNNNANGGQPTRAYGSKIGCFEIANAAPLPVSLTDLAVNYNSGNSTIRWTTSQEINIENYIVERSTDGINFEAIGVVASRNLLTVQVYTFVDDKVPSSKKNVFYRIRISERDGRSGLSNVVNIKVANTAINGMMVTPNPSSSDAQVKFTSEAPSKATIHIYDAAGKLVSSQQANVQKGNNSIILNNISKMSEGVFVVKLMTGTETYSTKLLIWK